jgi:hypothetical protein
MTKLLKEVLAEIEKLPEQDQDAAAGALLEFLDQSADRQLTAEQVAEVERRRADPNEPTFSLEEVRESFRQS